MLERIGEVLVAYCLAVFEIYGKVTDWMDVLPWPIVMVTQAGVILAIQYFLPWWVFALVMLLVVFPLLFSFFSFIAFGLAVAWRDKK